MLLPVEPATTRRRPTAMVYGGFGRCISVGGDEATSDKERGQHGERREQPPTERRRDPNRQAPHGEKSRTRRLHESGRRRRDPQPSAVDAEPTGVGCGASSLRLRATAKLTGRAAPNKWRGVLLQMCNTPNVARAGLAGPSPPAARCRGKHRQAGVHKRVRAARAGTDVAAGGGLPPRNRPCGGPRQAVRRTPLRRRARSSAAQYSSRSLVRRAVARPSCALTRPCRQPAQQPAEGEQCHRRDQRDVQLGPGERHEPPRE